MLVLKRPTPPCNHSVMERKGSLDRYLLYSAPGVIITVLMKIIRENRGANKSVRSTSRYSQHALGDPG
ncbi:hypothetical protein EYF80_026862 [Liparis tanakae]|uniref:Uncharacterized protein n=1 Tax=Liparis tanakae TaxID=230148 RepID=A0A4Z2HBK6_9TELE|nr:hypothetical protein EYF80_026862 [Liparis tanakae]